MFAHSHSHNLPFSKYEMGFVDVIRPLRFGFVDLTLRVTTFLNAINVSMDVNISCSSVMNQILFAKII